MAEHLVTARAYVRDRDGTARVHFTVSPEHRAAVEAHVAALQRRYEDRDTRYDVNLSEQRPDTDTLAATLNNQPFREPDGSLSFRPGGHGALLANLNDLGADIVFIQNIDNVAMDDGVAPSAAGRRWRAFWWNSRRACSTTSTGSTPRRRRRSSTRCSTSSAPRCPSRRRKAVTRAPAAERVRFLRETLNRPLRVCGMVPSAGEPGGGPFWVMGADGACSLQIVESSQVNMAEPHQRDAFAASTHFNPVDLVCGVRDRFRKVLRPDALQRSAERFHLHQVQRRAQAQGTGASGALERRDGAMEHGIRRSPGRGLHPGEDRAGPVAARASDNVKRRSPGTVRITPYPRPLHD